jgi:hypothetical protein
LKNLKSLRDIHRATFPAAELLIGLGLAQAIATLQVYASNHRLFNQMAAVAAAGFLPVPTPEVIPGLLSLGTALAGGLLFTLSVGAGLAFLSTAAAWWWAGRVPRSRLAAAVPVGIQAALLLLMNSRGFDPWVSLYFIIIPPAVFWVTRRSLARRERPPERWFVLWRLLPVALLALAWSTQYDRSLFIDLRDHLLMSNAAGRSVSSFYYRYTLYPAEVFKPLDQRLIRTVAWPDADPPPADVRQALIRNDYLPVAAAGDADLGLRMEAERMRFTRKGQSVLDTTTTRFLSDPRRALVEISTFLPHLHFLRHPAGFSDGALLPAVRRAATAHRHNCRRPAGGCPVCCRLSYDRAGHTRLFPFQPSTPAPARGVEPRTGLGCLADPSGGAEGHP